MAFNIKVGISRPKTADDYTPLILFANKSRKSKRHTHIFFILEGEVIHSDDNGIERVPLHTFLETRIVVDVRTVRMTCTIDQFNFDVDKDLGKKYSMHQWWGFFFRWTRWVKMNFANGDKEFICSEFVASKLNRWSCIKFDYPMDFLKPHEVFERC